MRDLRVQYFWSMAGVRGANGVADTAELDEAWRVLVARAQRGEISDTHIERARPGYELLLERARARKQRAAARAPAGNAGKERTAGHGAARAPAGKQRAAGRRAARAPVDEERAAGRRTPRAPGDALVYSRVRDQRAARFVSVALMPDLSVWSPVPGFIRTREEVARAVTGGAPWPGRGAPELAALITEIGRRITPDVGLVASNMGPWLELYIAYETHSVTRRAIREHFQRTAHPDLDLLYRSIARCRGRRDLDQEEIVQYTQFVWVNDAIQDGTLVGDDDHWRVPVPHRWRETVFDQGLVTVDECFVVAVDHRGPLVVRPAEGTAFRVSR